MHKHILYTNDPCETRLGEGGGGVKRRGEDGWHSGRTKSSSVCFSLWFEILNIWFTITLSGLGLSYGAAVASPFVLLFMVLKY